MSGWRSGGGIGRLTTKANAAGSYMVGTQNVTGNGGTSSWGQITASLSADTLLTTIQVVANSGNPNPGTVCYVEVGIGGAGAEAPVVTAPITNSASGAALWSLTSLPIPARIASGQRIAARVTIPGAMNSTTISIVVFGVLTANLETV